MYWGVLTIQRQIGEISIRSPWKFKNFPFLALFSTYPSLKSGTPGPIQILSSKSAKIGLSAHKVGRLEVKYASSGSI